MAVMHHWTVADLEQLPNDGKRYEIIGGDLYVSKQPHYYHQRVCFEVGMRLGAWNSQIQLGEVNFAPGVIFSVEDAVAPDLKLRLTSALNGDGKLHEAPELAVEVLSAGKDNERRDREIKLQLYSRRGVLEYWLIDWRLRCVDVYRGDGTQLISCESLSGDETLKSGLLPGLSCRVESLFSGIPAAIAE